MAAHDTEKITAGAAALGIQLDDEQASRLARHAELLEEWNRRINLTSIDPADFVPLHVLDSLTVARGHRPRAGDRIADVGPGAGFPGLPLKIAFPGTSLVLLEATRKKLAFLEAVTRELGLEDVTTIHGRAEDLGRQPEWRERFDLVTARAVARLNVLVEYLLPLTRIGGVAVALKSASIDDELAEAAPAVKRLGGGIRDVKKVRLPETDIERALVVIEKTRSTPKRYPRAGGEIGRRPLT